MFNIKLCFFSKKVNSFLNLYHQNQESPIMILITGIAGFIGSHLAEALKSRKIVGIDNFNDFYDPAIKRQNWKEVSENTDAVLEEGDIRNQEFLKKVFSRYPIKTVVHLAAMAGVRPSLKNPALYQEVNIQGTMNILEMMKAFEVKNHVFASSSSVYGEHTEFPFHEEMRVDRPISFYAATKKACEEINHVYTRLYGIKTVNLRFFTVYGPRQRPDLAIHKFARLMADQKPLPVYGDGSFRRDFTYIDDITHGLLKSIQFAEESPAGVFETFNLGESETVSVIEMIQALEKALGLKAQIQFLPPEPGDVPLTYASIQKARTLLGYDPKTPFSQGIKNFARWFLNHEKKV